MDTQNNSSDDERSTASSFSASASVDGGSQVSSGQRARLGRVEQGYLEEVLKRALNESQSFVGKAKGPTPQTSARRSRSTSLSSGSYSSSPTSLFPQATFTSLPASPVREKGWVCDCRNHNFSSQPFCAKCRKPRSPYSSPRAAGPQQLSSSPPAAFTHTPPQPLFPTFVPPFAPPMGPAAGRRKILVLVQWLGPSFGCFAVQDDMGVDMLALPGVGRDYSLIAYLPVYCEIPPGVTPSTLRLPLPDGGEHQTSPLLINHLASIGRSDVKVDYFWKFGDWICADCGLTNWAERKACKNGPCCALRGGPRPPTRLSTRHALCLDAIARARAEGLQVYVVSGEGCWARRGSAPQTSMVGVRSASSSPTAPSTVGGSRWAMPPEQWGVHPGMIPSPPQAPALHLPVVGLDEGVTPRSFPALPPSMKGYGGKRFDPFALREEEEDEEVKAAQERMVMELGI